VITVHFVSEFTKAEGGISGCNLTRGAPSLHCRHLDQLDAGTEVKKVKEGETTNDLLRSSRRSRTRKLRYPSRAMAG